VLAQRAASEGLVGRVQWKVNQPSPLKKERVNLEGALTSNLKFIPFVEDIDIVHSLLTWMAEQNNKLA
jgi:hypothetical protein